MILTAALPAFASAGEGCLTAAGAGNGQELLATSPAVVYSAEGRCLVAADSSLIASGAPEYVVLLGEQTYEMLYCNEMAESLSVFEADASLLSSPQVLSLAQSVQVGEQLIYYFCSAETGDVLEGTAYLAEQDGSLVFNTNLPNGLNQNQILYPAIAVNQAGELAVIHGSKIASVMANIEEGGTAPTPPPSSEPAPDNPTPNPGNPTPAPVNPSPIPYSRGHANPTPDPGNGSGSGLSTELIIGIAAVVVAAGVLAAVLLSRRKNSSGSAPAPAQPIIPTQPAVPIQPTAPVGTPERIEPVVIEPQPKPGSSVLYLCCEGGPLDGRRYPVGTATMLIGRDPSCNICYPADTKGVSRRHCEIFWKNGVLNIMDLGSTSGTFIRGKGQITANVPVAVNAGDTFYLGEKRNAFVIRMGD